MQIEEPELTQDEPAKASNVELNLDIYVCTHSSARDFGK